MTTNMTPAQIVAESLEQYPGDARIAVGYAVADLGAELTEVLMNEFTRVAGLVFAAPPSPFCRHEWTEVIDFTATGTVLVHASGRVLDGTAEIAEEATAIEQRDRAGVRHDMATTRGSR